MPFKIARRPAGRAVDRAGRAVDPAAEGATNCTSPEPWRPPASLDPARQPVKPADIDAKRWRQPGSAGFWAWVQDVVPCLVPVGASKVAPWVPSQHQYEELTRLLDSGKSVWIISWPRRHGKSQCSALVLAWRLMSRPRESVVMLGNTVDQSASTTYAALLAWLRNTPLCAALEKLGRLRYVGDNVHFDPMHSKVSVVPARPRSLVGRPLTSASITELHGSTEADLVATIQGSMLEADDGLLIIDSTRGEQGGPLDQLEKAAREDPGGDIAISIIEYEGLEDAVRRAPPWLRADRLRTIHRTSTRSTWQLQYLNRHGAGADQFFDTEALDRCVDRGYDPDSLSSFLAEGQPFKIGVGLDRASSRARYADRTILSLVCKTVGADEQDHVYLLDDYEVPYHGLVFIQTKIAEWAKKYNQINQVAIEAADAQDVAAWAQDHYPTALMRPTAERQSAMFNYLHRMVTDDPPRLHVHPRVGRQTLQELAGLRYEVSTSGRHNLIRVGHGPGRHDDRAYALGWGVWGLSQMHLVSYSLPGVYCNNPVTRDAARHCVLQYGHLHPICKAECRSWQRLEALYARYRDAVVVDPLPIEQFYAAKVAVDGPHVFPR